MDSSTKRVLAEGALYGAMAGVIFGAMEVVGAAVMGNPAAMPIKMFASVVLGRDALVASSAGVLVAGVVIHLALSSVFGAIYGGLYARLGKKTLTSFWAQGGLGLLFGVALWAVNFQVIARLVYPWFLETPQFLQMMMHAMFFGVPLGLFIAATERRVQRAPAPHPA